MARSRVMQNSLSGGVISPVMKGRRDLESYYNSLEEAENVVLLPQGGVERRQGLFYTGVTHALTNGSGRLFVFEFSLTQRYLFLFDEDDLRIYTLAGTLLYTWTGWNATADMLREFDIIQSADTVIITHESMVPIKIVRGATDTSWTATVITFKNIPYYDYTEANIPDYQNFGTSQTVDITENDIVWNYDGNDTNGTNGHLYQATAAGAGSTDLSTEDYTVGANWTDLGERENLFDGGYPRTCTFHQGRLWFGSIRDKPTSVIGSVVNDYFNFDLGYGDVQADSGIFDTIDTDQFNAIQNIISGRNLVVMTSSAEYINTADVITPTSSAWYRQTGYGSKRLKPVVLDGSIFFTDRYGKTLRNFVYTDSESAYTSLPVSIRAEHLLTDITDIGVLKGTTESSNTLVYIINGDGSLAVLNIFPGNNTYGFTKWTTPNGTFKAVEVTYDSTFFLVERDGVEYLEVISNSYDGYMDHRFEYNPGTAINRIEVDSVLYNNDTTVQLAGITQEIPATVTFESGTYYAYADSSDGTYISAGLNYDVTVKTLPISISSQAEGNIAHLPKRITRVFVDLYNTKEVYVNNFLVTSRTFSATLDSEFPLITGQEEVRLLGYNNTGQITITQSTPSPMTLLALDLEVSF